MIFAQPISYWEKLMAVVRMLKAPITAAGGSDVLVALGSFLACFGRVPGVFLLIAWVDTHFWPGEMHFYPTLTWRGCCLPPLFVQFTRCSHLLLLVILSSPSGPSHWALSATPEEKTQLLFNGEVFDLFWFCTTWCPSSSMRAEYGQCIGRGIWPLLTCFIYCDAHLHLLSWAWTLLCDWDIWFPSCTFIAGDSALHGYLVISSKLFVLILLEIVWCRTVQSLHKMASWQRGVCVEHLNRCKTSTWWCRFLLLVRLSFFHIMLVCQSQTPFTFQNRI